MGRQKDLERRTRWHARRDKLAEAIAIAQPKAAVPVAPPRIGVRLPGIEPSGGRAWALGACRPSVEPAADRRNPGIGESWLTMPQVIERAEYASRKKAIRRSDLGDWKGEDDRGVPYRPRLTVGWRKPAIPTDNAEFASGIAVHEQRDAERYAFQRNKRNSLQPGAPPLSKEDWNIGVPIWTPNGMSRAAYSAVNIFGLSEEDYALIDRIPLGDFVSRKPGRPPIGDRAMTRAEIQRRYREKKRSEDNGSRKRIEPTDDSFERMESTTQTQGKQAD
jgi:hypothetical protein